MDRSTIFITLSRHTESTQASMVALYVIMFGSERISIALSCCMSNAQALMVALYVSTFSSEHHLHRCVMPHGQLTGTDDCAVRDHVRPRAPSVLVMTPGHTSIDGCAVREPFGSGHHLHRNVMPHGHLTSTDGCSVRDHIWHRAPSALPCHATWPTHQH